MNKNLYRVVFNKIRGLMMAVAEIAASHGGADHQEDGEKFLKLPVAKMTLMAFAVMMITGANLFFMPAAHAQIVANKAAPQQQRPTVTTTASGIPQVNIQTPNQQGISHNQYSQFDVNKPGVILNNASAGVKTQTGGWVMPNPNLANGGANVILNEVNSSHPSMLHGYVEVAGQRAQVIIANPSGVTCDGCGFINASRTTLTTGQPIMNNGNLDGYVVHRGQVLVNGQGMDTSQSDYTDIIARSVKVNAGIWANALNVTTGSNRVNTDGTVKEKIEGEGDAPSVSVDVAQLGGMYAQKIRLVGTEAGLGVRNAGNIGAKAGEVIIQADGHIHNHGQIASGKVQLAGGKLVNDGLIDGGDTLIKAKDVINEGKGKIYGDHIGIESDVLTNQSRQQGNKKVSPVIAARERLDIGSKVIVNNDHATLFSGKDMVIGGRLDDQGHAIEKADLIDNRGATIDATGSLNMSSKRIDNINTHVEMEEKEISREHHREYQPAGSDQMYDESEIIETHENNGSDDIKKIYKKNEHGDIGEYLGDNYYIHDYDVVLKQTQLKASDSGKITAGKDITIHADHLSNDKSQIMAGGDLNVYADKVDNIDAKWEKLSQKEYSSLIHIWGYTKKVKVFQKDRRYEQVAEPLPVPVSTVLSESNLKVNAYGDHQSVVGSGTKIGLRDDSAWFTTMAKPSMGYLIESDPRFTSYHEWISSDYFLEQLKLNPTLLPKRLGDGYYESQLVRQQIAALTGKRFLDGDSDDEEEYKKLMAAGAEFIKKYKLKVGEALTKEHMSQLTSNVVLLVERRVDLPDGTKQTALVPQLYLHAGQSPMNGAGAVMSAENMHLDVKNTLNNSGTLAANQMLAFQANNIHNMGGHVTGNDVSVHAQRDIQIHGGVIEANNGLVVKAERDLNMISSTHSDQKSTRQNNEERYAEGEITNVASVSTLRVNGAHGALTATAGRDANLNAANVMNQGDGHTAISAEHNINMGVVKESASDLIESDENNHHYQMHTNEVGSAIVVAKDVTLNAGNDVLAKGTTIQSQEGTVAVSATNNVHVEEARSTVYVDDLAQHTDAGLLSSNMVMQHDMLDKDVSNGSALSGQAVHVSAGNDVRIKGSDMASDKDTVVDAKGNVEIVHATDTISTAHQHIEETSGLFTNGGLSVTLGTQISDNKNNNEKQIASSSTVGSVHGDVDIHAGNVYHQIGSDVIAPEGDIQVAARKVTIESANEHATNTSENHFESTGLTFQVTNPVLSFAESMKTTYDKAKGSNNNRIKVLAAAGMGMSAFNAVKLNKKDPSKGLGDAAQTVSLSISLGSSSSDQRQVQEVNSQKNGQVLAGGNITIDALGDSAHSDITVRGSDVKAGGNVALQADHDVKLLAAENTTTDRSKNSSRSGSIGVAIDTNNGINANVSVSGARGHGDGDALSYVNSHVEAGHQLSITSGKDTTISGAVAAGKQVTMDVGTSGEGNLTIASLQDKNTFEGSQEKLGGSVSFGTSGIGGNLDAGYAKADGNLHTVNEQSGIAAGNDGFHVHVAGNTDLVGGKIASTDAAAQYGKNTLVTNTLTQSDIVNESQHKANAYSASVGTSGGSVGFDHDADDQHSTTKSGISQANVTIADAEGQQAKTGMTVEQTLANINTDVSSDRDTGKKLTQQWDGQQALNTMQSNAEVVQMFGRETAMAIGTYATEKVDELQRKIDIASSPEEKEKLEAEKRKWDDGGAYRIAMHAATGALSGNLSGALGAGTSAALMPTLAKSIDELDVPDAVKKGMKTVTSATLGAAVGDVSGMASALNVDKNNRELHKSEAEKLKKLMEGKTLEEQVRLRAAACSLAQCANGVSENDPYYQQLKALQYEGDGYEHEKEILRATGEFKYERLDSGRDWITSNEKYVSKTFSVGKVASGSLGVAAGYAAVVGGDVVCAPTLGGGCVIAGLGMAGAGLSFVEVKNGMADLVSDYEYKEGNKVLNSLSFNTHQGDSNVFLDVGVNALIDVGGSLGAWKVFKYGKKLQSSAIRPLMLKNEIGIKHKVIGGALGGGVNLALQATSSKPVNVDSVAIATLNGLISPSLSYGGAMGTNVGGSVADSIVNGQSPGETVKGALITSVAFVGGAYAGGKVNQMLDPTRYVFTQDWVSHPNNLLLMYNSQSMLPILGGMVTSEVTQSGFAQGISEMLNNSSENR